MSILLSTFESLCAGDSWIRINQLGYLPCTIKVAVFICEDDIKIERFQLKEATTGTVVFRGQPKKYDASDWGMKSAYRLDFTQYERMGSYYIQMEDIKSPRFRIAKDVYQGTADFILHYMRQQRCGYNPYLKDACHLHDGIIVDHPTKTGQKIDVT
ncbi:MAG: hypothetical protein JXM79_04680, partial [Sedimentisphaerales bacterium]|nr:hypothetical protein [Sedimentisphaerales bacterium]